MRFKNILIILFVAFLDFGCYITATAQFTKDNGVINPIYGKLMLVGSGEMTNRTATTFAFLAGFEKGNLVIISKADGSGVKIHPQWQKLIGNILVVTLDKPVYRIADTELEGLRNASAIWIMDDFSGDYAGLLLKEELNGVLRRGGIIGGMGVAAESIATLIKDDNKIREGFNLLPNSYISATNTGDGKLTETINRLPGRVIWEIPSQAAVVIHSGRQISVIGDQEVTLRTSAYGDWPERVETYGPPVDELPFTADLISWNRSAVSRMGEIYPPAVAPEPEVPRGALMIIGGNGFPEGMWEKVVEFAGGKDANYVCFTQSPGSTGAEKLRELGCKNIAVHMVKVGVDGINQGNDKQLLEDLEKADAVYFGGGRTYQYMDAYLDTEAHGLIDKVLERGGIVIGSSAGAQIQGDFLVRGDPRTNDSLWMEGNDQGLGFIKGVIIDAHFRERGREDILPSLLEKYPQMLGIGIDETTAILVQGTTAEVIGPHSVTFYDFRNSAKRDGSSGNFNNTIILMSGEKYDLKNRIKINP